MCGAVRAVCAWARACVRRLRARSLRCDPWSSGQPWGACRLSHEEEEKKEEEEEKEEVEDEEEEAEEEEEEEKEEGKKEGGGERAEGGEGRRHSH